MLKKKCPGLLGRFFGCRSGFLLFRIDDVSPVEVSAGEGMDEGFSRRDVRGDRDVMDVAKTEQVRFDETATLSATVKIPSHPPILIYPPISGKQATGCV